jgi:hypothetical protein
VRTAFLPSGGLSTRRFTASGDSYPFWGRVAEELNDIDLEEADMADEFPGASGAQNEESGVEQAKEQAREQAGQLADKVTQTAREQVDQRSTEVGEKAGSLASDLRSVSEQLRSQGNDNGAKIADQVAERAERAGSYLSSADSDRILGDIEDLGRRQPWLVLAGGIALGVAGARFLKASSTQRYQVRSRPQALPAGGYPSGDSGFDSSGYGTSTQSIGAAPAVPAPAVVGSDGV